MRKFKISSEAIRFLQFSVGAVGVVSVPIGVWWYTAYQKRQQVAHDVATRIRIPGVPTTDDFLMDQCRPGDLVLFDRRWETCASGPWAALACLAAKTFLCGQHPHARYVAEGNFDHVGIIVPGLVRTKADEFDPSNLLLLEATPQGIVARSLKTRLERTQSRSVILLPLNLPGEQRDFENFESYDEDEDDDDDDDDNFRKKKKNKKNNSDDEESNLSARELSVRRTRRHLERELGKFRDTFMAQSPKYHFEWMYSTLTLGGAVLYGLGLAQADWIQLGGPVSPSAWLVLMALQQGAAAQNIYEQRERFRIKPEDFLRPTVGQSLDDDTNPLRLRPGWRFLAPLSLRDRHAA
ncbi:hypothetical protein ACA910_015838 [Epithemia clementina (nom. ined.)]